MLLEILFLGEDRVMQKFAIFIYLRICTSSTGAKTIGHKSPTRFKHQYNVKKLGMH